MSSTQAAGEQTAQRGAAASAHPEAGYTTQHHTCRWTSGSLSECWLLSPHSLENEQTSYWSAHFKCTIMKSVFKLVTSHTHGLCTYPRLYIGPAVLLCLVWCPSLQPGPQVHKSNHSLLWGGCQWTQSHHPVEKLKTCYPRGTMDLAEVSHS